MFDSITNKTSICPPPFVRGIYKAGGEVCFDGSPRMVELLPLVIRNQRLIRVISSQHFEYPIMKITAR